MANDSPAPANRINGCKDSDRILCLDVGHEAGRLKISAFEQRRGEAVTTRYYEEIGVTVEHIGRRGREMVDTLNRANRTDRLTPELLGKLKEIGQRFRDELLTLNVKKILQGSRADHLIVSLDEHLVSIPWELFHDGRMFMGQRFSMGRVVKTRQSFAGRPSRELTLPLNMLILADPVGDLKAAYHEGLVLRDTIERHPDIIQAAFRSGNITSDFIKEKIRAFDVVHFAGHGDYHGYRPETSGWRLKEGAFTAQDVIRMAGTAHMPSLVFSNACQTARSKDAGPEAFFQDRLFGLADAFLHAGVRHYIGTYWEILDEPGRRFALSFYHNLLAGAPIGVALQSARYESIRAHGEENLVWASYVLYGDPSTCYAPQASPEQFQPFPSMPHPDRPSAHQSDVRAPEEIISFSETNGASKKGLWSVLLLGLILVVGLALWGYDTLQRSSVVEREKAALAAFQSGDYAQAMAVCRDLQKKAPARAMSRLIAGNIHFMKGDLEEARRQFEQAVNSRGGEQGVAADAFLGLGRIASLSDNTENALQYYQKAAQAAPRRWEPYMYQAVLLEQEGRHGEAADLLKQMRQSPGEADPAALADMLKGKISLSRNKDRRERIDQLAAELLAHFDETVAAKSGDNWTSRPLSLWIMDLDEQGYNLMEGAAQLLVSGLSDRLVQEPRIKIVERALLDKVMDELKIGSFKLAAPGTALTLGRLTAARLILAGRITYSPDTTQVSLRCIETETGEVKAVVSDIFKPQTPVMEMVERLSDELIKTFSEHYPLQTRITEVTDSQVVLNIGKDQGVRMGQEFCGPAENRPVVRVISLEKDRATARIEKPAHLPLAPGQQLVFKP